VPEGFDYETWLGPAPEAPYCPARTHVNWRWIFDYSGGQVTDWGGHHPDIAQWGMDTQDTGPITITRARAIYDDHPIYNTAVNYSFECKYKNGVKLIVSSGARRGVTFEGTEGTIWVDRGSLESNPKTLIDAEIKENEIHLYESKNHARNFIDCVYSREEPIAPIETAHRSITIAHLGNIAMKLGRDLKWNPKKERFIGDDEANSKLSRPYRAPWSLT
jgi:predicted dehydrogenase